MESARYKAFVAAAEAGSFTKAAEQLGYTPSGVSQLVAALENELGFSLLLRHKKGVALTSTGALLLPAAQEILDGENRVVQLAAEVRGLAVGRVCISSYSSIATHWLPGVIRDFQREYPNIRIDLMETVRSRGEIKEWMEKRKVDMAFLSYQQPMEFDWIPLAKDRMLAILPREHPLAGAAAFPLERIPQEALIMPGCGCDIDVVAMLERNRLTPNIRFNTMLDVTAMAMVEQGLGVSLVNELSTLRWKCDVAQLPLDPPQYAEFGIALPALHESPPAVRRFVNFTVERLAQPGLGEKRPR